PLPRGVGARRAARHAPPRRPLPPRPRQALSANRRPGEGPRATGNGGHDVPRDGHDLLAGEGRRGAGWSRAMTRVERRGFIVGTFALLAAPLECDAQPPGKIYR